MLNCYKNLKKMENTPCGKRFLVLFYGRQKEKRIKNRKNQMIRKKAEIIHPGQNKTDEMEKFKELKKL